jgi:hypothetical protein
MKIGRVIRGVEARRLAPRHFNVIPILFLTVQRLADNRASGEFPLIFGSFPAKMGTSVENVWDLAWLALTGVVSDDAKAPLSFQNAGPRQGLSSECSTCMHAVSLF